MKYNYTEEQKEMINGLLDELKAEIIVDNDNGTYNMTLFTKEDLDNFKKERGLIKSLEVNRWHKVKGSDGGKMLLFIERFDEHNEIIAYGFGFDGEWYDSSDIWRDDLELATHEEVETALKREATKRGFKEGVMLECAISDGVDTIGKYKEFYCNSLDFYCSNLASGYVSVFDVGNWATIIEDTQLDKLEKKYKELGEEIQTLKNQ